ncbi:Kelch repeat-containing protein [Arthrospiribacter ruber]|uniref:Kelch-like protein n=1 Tax=Arthrospiribacter ruber TaxID=2487934 RepID=A0A951MEB4_9BACT|nr:kelch motif-containing protein [Arthrospiribacter ruber]MBW3466807.1 kelch-like protein [Arthrospiribacter ruber]MBW3469599.1 kelch-like protein [Arthrospiribacter ruber]MBW3470326.1 kelch-like protein [Arthrospiribacter ruber]
MKPFLLTILILVSSVASAQSVGANWKRLQAANQAVPRHENSLVECNGKFYALGGRGERPVEAFDPETNEWTILADSPMEFHHFQAIAFENEIYVLGAFTGPYPHETPIPEFLIFNPQDNSWRKGPEIPESRRRGSAGVFTRGDKIYMVCGIIDGHWNGFVPWFDEYDTKTGEWKVLPDAPRPRDHFSASLVGDRAYIAGGRTSHAEIGKVLELTIPEVDYFDFKTNSWSTVSADLPTPRGGTSSIGNEPYLLVMNGESIQQVQGHSEVEVLDTRDETWTRLPDLNQGRHGTGVVYWKGKVFVAAGSANRGGGPELNDIECLEWK